MVEKGIYAKTNKILIILFPSKIMTNHQDNCSQLVGTDAVKFLNPTIPSNSILQSDIVLASIFFVRNVTENIPFELASTVGQLWKIKNQTPLQLIRPTLLPNWQLY